MSLPVLFYRNRTGAVAQGERLRASFERGRINVRIGPAAISVVPVDAKTVAPDLVYPEPGRLNRLTGTPGESETNIPLFGGVRYSELYPNVDMEWTSHGRTLKSEFVVRRGGDPAQIRIRYAGADGARIEADQSLVLETQAGTVRELAPSAHQVIHGVERAVPIRYRLTGECEVGFEIAKYDPAEPLIIDPQLSYSTYLGGSGVDAATSVAVDASGNMYIAGYTDSTDFPLAAPLQPTSGHGVDGFVAKFNPAGTQLIYATYLGGTYEDRISGMVIDGSGNVIIAGYTLSTNFPIAYPSQRYSAGGRDAFVTKINAAGTALVFSTYLGGSGADAANAVAVDSSGNIYVAGETKSADFPVVNAYQATNKGLTDGFLTKLSPTGAKLYSTYVGGSGDDRIMTVAVDSSGAVYLGGNTTSPDFPTVNAFQPANAGGQDGFVTKLAPGGSSLVFSTYFGGSGGMTSTPESINALALDASGNIYVAGSTPSTDLPHPGAFQTGIGGGGLDAFAGKLSSTGTLVFATYLGGLGIDAANALAVDNSGFVYVAGTTNSIDFPVPGATQPAKAANPDAFLVQIATGTPSIVFGTYLGGGGADSANAIALANGAVYLAGQTTSTDFPRNGAYQNYGYTEGNAFLTKYNFNGNLQNGTVTPASASATTQSYTFTFTHGAGFTTISSVWALIQSSTNSQNACMWQYNALRNELSLLNDGGTQYLGPINPSSGSTLQNSQCTIGGPGTSISGSGNTLTVVLPVTASAFFGGTRNIYLYSMDLYGKQVGWDLKGTWTLAVTGSPSFGNVSPSAGSGTNGVLTFPFKHSGGFSQLVAVYGLVGPSTSLPSTCMWKYMQSSNSLWLLNDQATAYLGPITPSSGSNLQNSQCTIGGSGTTVTFAADTLSVTLPITFAAAFGGTKNIYFYASDTLNQGAGWTANGTWTVPGSSVPSVVSVTPSSGSGASSSFAFAFSHTAGYTRLNYVYGLFQSSLNLKSACMWRYSLATGSVWLLNDAATAYLGPNTAGAAGTLQNTQCSMDTSAFSATGSSTNLTINAKIAFNSAFGGVKNVYLDAVDLSGQETGFVSKGTWTVPGGSSPSIVGVTPNTGSGGSSVFNYQYSDSGGVSQLAGVWGLIAAQISLPNSCMWEFVPASNAFYLLDDAAGTYLGPIAAGSSATLQNSQCILNGSLSSASTSGSTLTVGVSLTFKAGFSGLKNLYLYTQDLNTSAAGWTNKGTWTTP